MSRGEVFLTIVAAVVLGAIITVIPDADQRLSVDLWLVTVAALAGLTLLRRALDTVPGERDRLRLAIRFRRDTDDEPPLPRDLLTLEGSLLTASGNARSFHYRLRPRLRMVTAHRLRINRGIDLDREPTRAAEALGESQWLIDDLAPTDDDGRTPSSTDLARLLDRSEPPTRGESDERHRPG